MDKVSFVIPCYWSEQTLAQVVDEIVLAMQKESFVYEIILVNDGSGDGTWNVIQDLAVRYDNILGISLAKNFGQHSALMAGFHFCSGDYVVCMDDDGQTPPDAVGRLLAKLCEGYDVVFAKYPHKMHATYRNWGSRINDFMVCSLVGKPDELFISSYFATRRFVIDEVVRYESPYPYMAGLLLRTTRNVTNVEVEHRARTQGISGYTFRKLLSLWLNGFTAFSVKPLRVATLAGCSCALLGGLYGIFVIAQKMINPSTPAGWSSLMAGLLFIGGIMMIMQGLIGEYIGRIYISQNKMPQYVIREIAGNIPSGKTNAQLRLGGRSR